MANINDVFGEYDESKPMISFNLPSKEELVAELLGLIPGGRALKNFHDNPEGSASETLSLAAEDVVPFYGAAKNDADIEDILKEAVMLGVPMPYIKHPVTGKSIPNNVREAFNKPTSYYGFKHLLKSGKRNLYADPNKIVGGGAGHGLGGEGLATTARYRRTQEAVAPVDVPAGPYQHTNIGANVQNRGGRARGTNTVPTTGGKTPLNGTFAWQGEMYPPGRRLRSDDVFGPHEWENKYTRKLDAVIDKNEMAWEYMINKTRIPSTGSKRGVVPKEEIIDIAMKQGRPDIAKRVELDNNPRIDANGTHLTAFGTQQRHSKLSNFDYKDIGNRQVEKELREAFATLPNNPDIRYRFAEHYGVPDLYQSWINDPLPWENMKAETIHKRKMREASNRSRDKQYGRNIQR